MIKSIIELIIEFVLEPALITSGILFVQALVLQMLLTKKPLKAIASSLLGTFLSFIAITIFMVLSIRVNEPKAIALTYPVLLNIWYFAFKENKYRMTLSNIFMLMAFFSDFYIVEKLLFE